MELKRINIFISSPGDVSTARNYIKSAIDRINRLLAKDYGLLLETIGWEQIPPGKESRAQEVINPYVKSAHIFIGIFYLRFGTPTGLAESGTEEEYNIISNRWNVEVEKPTILMYFKKISPDRLSDPGSQLKKVLKFKKRIQSTDFYHEFEKDEDIEQMIEDALADWIKKNRDIKFSSVESANQELINEYDLNILSDLINVDNYLITNKNLKSIKNLINKGMIRNVLDEIYVEPVNSAEAFVMITKLLNTDAYYKKLFESKYFISMLKIHLKGLVLSRQHCILSDEKIDTILKIIILSPSAFSYVLHGDTDLYDNIIEHTSKMDADKKDFANMIIWNNLFSHILLYYTNDTVSGKLLFKIGLDDIVGTLITIKVSASFENSNAFEAMSKFPIMRYKAKEKIKKGQLVSISADLYVQNGNILMNLGEPQMALEEFDRALTLDISDEARVAALNNKGLILLNRGEKSVAANLFQDALKIKPDLKEVKNNLELCK